MLQIASNPPNARRDRGRPRPTRRARARARRVPVTVDPVESAAAARLRYVSDRTPGLRRRRTGSGFTYLDAGGKVIRDRDEGRALSGA